MFIQKIPEFKTAKPSKAKQSHTHTHLCYNYLFSPPWPFFPPASFTKNSIRVQILYTLYSLLYSLSLTFALSLTFSPFL